MFLGSRTNMRSLFDDTPSYEHAKLQEIRALGGWLCSQKTDFLQRYNKLNVLMPRQKHMKAILLSFDECGDLRDPNVVASKHLGFPRLTIGHGVISEYADSFPT